MRHVIATLLACLLTLSAADAASIRVRQECGFSFAACGEVFMLQQDGASVPYAVDSLSEPLRYTLAYVADMFVMTALGDNLLGATLPFGLAIYPGEGEMRTRAMPDSTAYGFIAMNAFPRGEGATRTVAIPAAPAEVPEPPAALLLAAGLAALGWRRRAGT